MNLEIKPIKNKLKEIIKRKDVYDIVLFGSSVKGKTSHKDVDIAIISETEFNLVGFHISNFKPKDFFDRRITLLNTLFREGYSLKFDKSFSELYGFKNKVLFKYELKGLTPSKKVKIVNILKKELVKKNNGEWLANQVFFVPVFKDYLIEKFFLNFNVKFKKYFILMH